MPYYSGWITVKCVEEPLYDLVLGNLPGVRKVDEPDPTWRSTGARATALPQRESEVHGEYKDDDEAMKIGGGEPVQAVSLAVTTRSCKRETHRPLAALKVPSVEVLKVTPQEFAEMQREDACIQACLDKQRNTTPKRKSRTVHEYQRLNGLLCRRCRFASGREALQLIVPKDLRQAVLTLAHDSIMAGHQGIRRTVAKVAEHFFWPGLQSEVKRYVKSCDICQMTFPKGRVG